MQTNSTPNWQIVVMGVAGCGKTTVGQMLAERLGCRFIDGDSLHPQANVEKMSAGIPLTDDDRWPWLDLVGQAVAGGPNPVDGFLLVKSTGTVVAASSLKKVYRDRIRQHAPATQFIHLFGDEELLWQRINERVGHFMKPEMLASQLQILENLGDDEPGHSLNIASPPELLVDSAIAKLNRNL